MGKCDHSDTMSRDPVQPHDFQTNFNNNNIIMLRHNNNNNILIVGNNNKNNNYINFIVI